MPIFNILDGTIFLKRKASKTFVTLADGLLPKRFETIRNGYLNMSNVMIDDFNMIQELSSIQCFPSPKLGSIVEIDGTEESDDFDYEKILILNGEINTRWSAMTMPLKMRWMKEILPLVSDIANEKQLTAWCDLTDFPPVHVFRYFLKNTGMLKGLNVKFDVECDQSVNLKTDEEFAMGYSTRGCSLQVTRVDTKILNPLQLKAFNASKRSGIHLLTGGPGTGKTHVCSMILRQWTMCGVKWRVSALAQRAVGRVSRFVRLPAQNFVNLDNLKRDPERRFITHLLIDEMSMVDTFTFASILRMLPNLACLVLVGDVDQLPPVGQGNIFEQLILSRSHTRLTENYRMKESRFRFTKVNSVPSGSTVIYPRHCDAPACGGMTIHMSQGDEFDKVTIITQKITSFTKQRKMIYTAVTRSKSAEVFIMGALTPELMEEIMYSLSDSGSDDGAESEAPDEEWHGEEEMYDPDEWC